ncbi:hypothetical protein GCM10022270_01230 [Terriglobus aquaticus]
MVNEQQLSALEERLAPLKGVQFDVLKLPREVLKGFEPSQIGSIAGALMDACIPQLEKIVSGEDKDKVAGLGLTKGAGILKDREAYPDYQHDSGMRVELKLLYVNPKDVEMKVPSTPREPSARLSQKVTVKNVQADKDVLLVVAYQLQPDKVDGDLFVPTIIDFSVLPVQACIEARDQRLTDAGGRWFGDYQTPAILSRRGKAKVRAEQPTNKEAYGRKESEGRDYNEDTNFGKLARIPYKKLQEFIAKHGLQAVPQTVASEGNPTSTLEEEILEAVSAADDLAAKS